MAAQNLPMVYFVANANYGRWIPGVIKTMSRFIIWMISGGMIYWRITMYTGLTELPVNMRKSLLPTRFADVDQMQN